MLLSKRPTTSKTSTVASTKANPKVFLASLMEELGLKSDKQVISV